MSKVKIAVLDTNVAELKKTVEYLEFAIVKMPSYSCFTFETFDSVSSFLNSNDEYDLLITEFDLETTIGIDVARRLNIGYGKTSVLYFARKKNVIGYLQQAMFLGDNVGVVFKCDPVNEINKVIMKVLKKIQANRVIKFETCSIKKDNFENKRKKECRYVFLKPVQIEFIEANGKYTRIYSSDEREYSATLPLKFWLEQLPRTFVQINRRTIVNLDFLEIYSKEGIKLNSLVHPLPLGKIYEVSFEDAYKRNLNFNAQ